MQLKTSFTPSDAVCVANLPLLTAVPLRCRSPLHTLGQRKLLSCSVTGRFSLLTTMLIVFLCVWRIDWHRWDIQRGRCMLAN